MLLSPTDTKNIKLYVNRFYDVFFHKRLSALMMTHKISRICVTDITNFEKTNKVIKIVVRTAQSQLLTWAGASSWITDTWENEFNYHRVSKVPTASQLKRCFNNSKLNHRFKRNVKSYINWALTKLNLHIIIQPTL